MKTPLSSIICAFALYSLQAAQAAVVVTTPVTLDFNDLGTNTAGVHMPASYGGFTWSSTDWHFMSLASVPTNTFLALSGHTSVLIGEAGRDFYFDGVRCWTRGGEPQGRFYFYLMRDGVVVYDGRNDPDGRQVFSPSHDLFTCSYTDRVDYVAFVYDSNGLDWNHLAVDDVQLRAVELQADPPVFIEVDPGLPSSVRNAVAWADYNGDGWKDVFIAASGSKGTTITKLYRNNGGTFVDSGLTGFTAIEEGRAAWSDCDNDGDPDLAVMGLTPAGTTSLRVYRNNITNFVAIPGNFVNVYGGDLGWSDVDGDGDQDLLVCGVTAQVAGSPYFTRLYRNDRTNFVSMAHPFPNCYLGVVAWADYDTDGDEDLFLCGSGAADMPEAQLFRNDAGSFTNVGANLGLQTIGGADWGDFDQDGDLDLLMTGQGAPGYMTSILRNDAGTFTDIQAGFTGLLWSACSWGDCDGDGDLDAAVAGYEAGTAQSYTWIFRNNHGTFVDTGAGTHGLYLGELEWVDVDNDGRLELCASGPEANLPGTSLLLYRNIAALTNTPPTAPAGLQVVSDGTTATLSWSPAADGQNRAAGLSYRVRVGTSPGAGDLVSASAVASNGQRRLTGGASASPALQFRVGGLHVGSNYHWSVQAVDGSWRGGAFAAESSFTALGAIPTAVAAAVPDQTGPVMTFAGSPGGAYRIEATTDLVTWTPVLDTVADAEGRIVVPVAGVAGAASFRAVRP